MVDPNGIYYLGPLGSFSHEAASVVANLIKAELISEQSVSYIFKKISQSNDKIGVVPIENSLEGPVNETLDNLFNYDNIYVIGELEKKIKLVLASKAENLDKIKKIYSHPHAFNEVKDKLEALGFKDYIPVESTSKAALLASNDSNSASICSPFAANLYNLNVLADSLSSDNNYTRFIVISKEMRISGNKSMILFTVSHKPGALYRVLQVFYEYNINITMIYSRPLKSIPWQYYFYLEYEGSLGDSQFLNKLKEVTELIKIKGSYNKLNNYTRL
ncbi:chorismate mutase [Sulfolobus sp. A20]|uniref:prephenate dehydratase n=1 Tax=Sulfolobaceae TaxID=118883 RepID=UPI000845C81C|nr:MULTISPECIES: prephenate dehydratase [unclassified Sulfolobus]TRM76132.1 ACT domain-containing protein [Sulfolobus sp. A20-N-F8]TRM78508.1 ACT domain-containing protein [Sulfolobus sp. B5]TRM83938.1 ACT domain-containing protein [Sulfolobus sp. A20-N-F6]TRM84450.1 ACT domain-containing protein [Sulfolobus sp. F3]TRM88634.1 ACT domain-containing protein [Sulfolobus sp. E3]TRM88737.1 ACT domain-containing protein [Sulfolobus sp. C3]TRM92812.1 ACT domain-containing protein [Sulfolobus sp. A2